MDHLIEGITKRWLKWSSLPFVFSILLMFYMGIASELSDWTGIVVEPIGYLLLGVPFAAALVGYIVWCVIHNRNAKKEKAAQAQKDTPNEDTKEDDKDTVGWILGIGCVIIAFIVVFILLFSGNGELKDGKYVIWAQEYHVAMSPETTSSYYLKGDPVQAKGNELTDYTSRCVVDIDFKNDGTFTISHAGKLLGTVPGYNGVGYKEENTGVTWMLEEVEKDVYYIHNVEGDTYLKWFLLKENWTTDTDIVDSNRQQYLICLERIK